MGEDQPLTSGSCQFGTTISALSFIQCFPVYKVFLLYPPPSFSEWSKEGDAWSQLPGNRLEEAVPAPLGNFL